MSDFDMCSVFIEWKDIDPETPVQPYVVASSAMDSGVAVA